MDAKNSSSIPSCKPFFLNIILLNKDELVANKVAEKTGKGFFGKAAAFAANKMVTDEKVLSNLTDGLLDAIGKAIQEIGINATMDVKYQQGPFVVIRIQVTDVDSLQLILSAKGPEFASNFSTLLLTVDSLGLADIVSNKVNEKIYGTINEGMMTKFSDLIPKKMQEKGVSIHCQVSSVEEEAEIFFELFERVNNTK